VKTSARTAVSHEFRGITGIVLKRVRLQPRRNPSQETWALQTAEKLWIPAREGRARVPEAAKNSDSSRTGKGTSPLVPQLLQNQ